VSANKGVFELERELTLVDKSRKTDQNFPKFRFSAHEPGRFLEDSSILGKKLGRVFQESVRITP